MSLTNCPHCTSPIPEAFASMPVCSICGGDLSATPAAPVWASIDIKTDNTRKCNSCGSNVKSILALECPDCGASLAPAGQVVDDIEKEKEKFESAVKSSNSSSQPSQITSTQQKAEPKKQAVKSESTLKSNTSSSEIKPYSEMKKEKQEDFISIKDKKKKKKEGFFVRLLRMLGLKKD